MLVRSPRPGAPLHGYSVRITSPTGGATVRTPRPVVKFVPTSTAGGLVDAQIEWRRSAPVYDTLTEQWSPAPTYAQTLAAVPSGEERSTQPPADLEKVVWFYRMRAGDLATGKWSAWTDPRRYVDVSAVLGSVSQYLEMNVGVFADDHADSAYAYLDMNVGRPALERMEAVVVYEDMNVGIRAVWRLVASYADLNVYPPTSTLRSAHYADLNVTADTPSPHIWWIRPEQGREGYVFNIYGHGFGAFQGEHDGRVFLGDLVCPVIHWERIPALSPPDAIVRADDPDDDLIRPEHGWIVVVVPQNAVSGLVKVILEGGTP